MSSLPRRSTVNTRLRGSGWLAAIGCSLTGLVLSLTFAGGAAGAPFLYAANNVSASLSQFDASGGALSPIGPVPGPVPPVASANSPEAAALSGDGLSLYVANGSGNTISQYDADPITGALTPKAPATVATGTGPASVLLSGSDLYVANSASNTISLYTVDGTTGAITPKATPTVTTGATPLRLAVAAVTTVPLKRVLYATNSGDGTVSQYSVDATTGALTPLATPTVAAGTGPRGVAVATNNKSVYVVNATANTISQYSVDSTTGALSAKAPASVGTGTAPREVVVNAGGAYVTNSADNKVSQYDISASTGALSAKTPATVDTGGSPLGISTVHDDGGLDYVYVINSSSNTISQYDVNSTTGVLTAKAPATLPTGGSPFMAAFPNIQGLSTDYAYVTNSADNTISQFDLNNTTGRLRSSTLPSVPTGSGQPFGVAASPDGKSVYVSANNDVVLQYDVASTGVLSLKSPASVAAGREPAGVAVSPDSKSVYVADKGSATLHQYDVARATGALTPKSPATVPTGGSPTGLAVSPNGKSLYVTNAEGGGVSEFDVDPATGALTAKATPTVATGDEPAGVAVSLDSKSVYVTFDDMSDKSVLQYDAAANGELSPKTIPKVAAGGGPSGVSVSPNGKSAYVVNEDDSTVSQYNLDATTGALTPKAPATVATGANPENVVVSPDSASVYVNAEGDNSVSQFDASAGGALTPKTSPFVSARGNPIGLAISTGPPPNTGGPVFGPPTVSIVTPVNGATFTVNQAVSASYSCVDAAGAPGILSCTAPAAPGARLDTSAGAHTFRVTATSRDGQSASATNTYTVTAVGAPALPALTGLHISPSAFVAAKGRGASLAAKKKKPKARTKKPKTGTRITYTDSLAATTVVTIYRSTRGHRVKGGSCSTARVKKGKKRGRACTRLVPLGSFSHLDRAGANLLSFTGRLKNRPLPPGKYSLTAVPHATSGTGNTARGKFTIKRR